MNDAIEIRQAVLEDLLAHAREQVPNECCGLLIGTSARIERAVRASNTRASPTRYTIDPADHFQALRIARATGTAVVGFYHSHPASPPVPSETDREGAAYPGHCYLIVSPGHGNHPAEVRGFTWEDGNFRPLTLVPLP